MTAKSIDERFHEVISNAVLWAVVACWLLEASMNARFGYKIAGIGLSAIFVAVAVLGAYLAVKFFAVRGRDFWDLRAWGRRVVFGVPLALCFCVCQASGWSTLGTMFADGMAARDTLASGRSSAADRLRLARDERAKLGAPRPIGTIEAELQRELMRKSKEFPDGRGPKALELEAELASAKRAAELDELIPQLVAGLEGREQVAEGTPHLDVLVRLTGAKPNEVAFWFPVVLTAVIGFFATFGFPLAGVGRETEPRRHEPDPLADFDWGPRRLAPPADYHQQGSGEVGIGGDDPSGRPRVSPRQDASAGPSGVPHVGGPAAAHVHGAPINISVALPAAGVGGGLGPAASPSPAAERITAEPKPLLPAPGAGDALKARALEASPVPQRPVERAHVQELIDHLLCFRAACVLDAAGGVVPAREMYERYVSWAGQRAISEQAFDTMFGELAGIARVSFGGVLHYRGVVLKSEPRLSAVGE